MYEVVGVRFKKAGKIYYFDPGDLPISNGDYVIVETVRGIEFGKVVVAKNKLMKRYCFAIEKVIRMADQKDKLIVEENKRQPKKHTTFA